VRYRSTNARVLARLRHAELQAAAGKSSTPAPRPAYPRSKGDPLARNERIPIDRTGVGKRTLWERPR
jgi:hypothetical protein